MKEDHLSVLELFWNKIYILKQANNLKKLLKIKVFHEKKCRKITLEDSKFSALKCNSFYHVDVEKCYFVYQDLVEIVLSPPHYIVKPLCKHRIVALEE